MGALDEINSLERDWRLTLRQPNGPERSRQLRLIQQQREGLWAARRRELSGYTYGQSHHGMPMGPADHHGIDLGISNGSTPDDAIASQESGVLDEPSIPPRPEHDSLRDLESLVGEVFDKRAHRKPPRKSATRSASMQASWARRKAEAAEVAF